MFDIFSISNLTICWLNIDYKKNLTIFLHYEAKNPPNFAEYRSILRLLIGDHILNFGFNRKIDGFFDT